MAPACVALQETVVRPILFGFFQPVRQAKSKSFLAALSEVQEVLGQINDIAVSQRLLGELAASQELSAHQDAVALAMDWIAHGLSHQFTALRNAVRRIGREQPFWER